MNTNNIISTPAITGNIGSCTSNVTTLTTHGDFWGEMKKDYVTNSCTGQVIEGPEHWGMGISIGFLVVILAVVIAIGLIEVMVKALGDF